MRLEQRLEALEARPAPVAGDLSPEKVKALHAAIHALLVAVRPGGFDEVHELLARLNTGTETDRDRALLAGIPPCHMSTHELVALMVRVDDLI